MGGNLFKLGRLPRDAYLEIEGEIRAYLDGKLGPYYRIPRYYGDKADFGDLDVVVSDAGLSGDWERVRMELVRDLGVERFKATGPVFSTVYRDFQVDYFRRPAEQFESTYNFLCFNDLGNLLGKMFRRFGLKYGEAGLVWVYRRHGGNYKRDILVSRDYRRIFEFLELDPGPWERGFDDLPAMFDWVLSSPYFSVAPYLDPARTTRRRIAGRKTVQGFIAYLEERGVARRYEHLADPEDYLPRVEEHFGVEVAPIVAAERAREARLRVIRDKYSGDLVRAWTGLEGKALGQFMKHFASAHDDLEALLYEMPPDRIRALVLAFRDRFEPS